mgnify:FL=1|tara:strand:+ start:4355 stop:4570 length:216 start_codon:yes stop_codon:yes gene_type:complete
MYTVEFLAAEKKVKDLELVFKANPSKKTATPLTQSRVELDKFSFNKKFTFEYRKERERKLILELVSLMKGE